MNASNIITAQSQSVVATLKNWSAPSSNWLVRNVAAPAIYVIASEGIALAGTSYHALATILKALPVTAQRLMGIIPQHMSWNHLYNDHMQPLASSLKTAVATPWWVFSKENLAADIESTVAVIFPVVVTKPITIPAKPAVISPSLPKPSAEPLLSRSWTFLKEHRVAATVAAVTTVTTIVGAWLYCSETADPFKEEREACLVLNDAKFEENSKGFTCVIGPRMMGPAEDMYSSAGELTEKYKKAEAKSSGIAPFMMHTLHDQEYKCPPNQMRTLTYEWNQQKGITEHLRCLGSKLLPNWENLSQTELDCVAHGGQFINSSSVPKCYTAFESQQIWELPIVPSK